MPRACRRSRREDLELLEINPLVLTPDDGSSPAMQDRCDDSAAFRHDPEEFPVSQAWRSAR
jgi:succinyl-CoA synthetase beta subunit